MHKEISPKMNNAIKFVADNEWYDKLVTLNNMSIFKT